MSYFAYPTIHQRTNLSCLYLLPIVNNVIINMNERVFLQVPAFSPFGISLEIELLQHIVMLFFFFFVFCLFRATRVACGGSQARGRIGATAGSLHHSHSNAGSKPHP